MIEIAFTKSTLDSNRRKGYEHGQVLDGSNRVIGLKVSDRNAGQLKLRYQVGFKYDGKARVVEQNTDPFSDRVTITRLFPES